MTIRVLIIDDDEPSCRLVRAIFKPEGIDVVTAHDAASGIARARTDRPELVLLDLHLPDSVGLDTLEKLRKQEPALPIVMLTAHDDVKTAVQAMRSGATDYLTKPVDDEELVVVVKRALATRALEAEVVELRHRLDDGSSLATVMGNSSQIRQVIEQVRIVATSSFTVLVTGETGVGKELVAQAIHKQSERSGKPFIAIDCGAIPEQLLESELFGHERGAFTGAERRKEGRFQLAEGGTLFLDEIGNLPISLQPKLLRALESRQVQPVGARASAPMDLRFVAATNDDLQARVTAGQFRADLYFRLAQYTISVPPLRERSSDVAYLTQRFIEEASLELRRPIQNVLPDAIAALEKYTWPGNVRELRNVVRQAVLETSDMVVRRETIKTLVGRSNPTAAAHSAPVTAGRSLRDIAIEAAEAAERQAICETLRATRGNKSRAAKALDTDYKTLHVKMKRLGIRGRDFAP